MLLSQWALLGFVSWTLLLVVRAHANCVENLPVFAALVLLGSTLWG